MSAEAGAGRGAAAELELRGGSRVVIHGLKGAAEYNGRRGVITDGPHSKTGRYEVTLHHKAQGEETPSQPKVLSLKPANLQVDTESAIDSPSEKEVGRAGREVPLEDLAVVWTKGKGLSSKALAVQTSPVAELQEGQVLLRVDKFAFTHMSLGYLLKGFSRNTIPFHKFFPCDEERFYRSGCWGVATVVETRHPKVTEGTRIYGLLPPSRYTLRDVQAVTPSSAATSDPSRIIFANTAVPFHMQHLRECEVLDSDNYVDPALEDWRIMTKESYTMAFFMDEMLLVHTGMINRVLISCASAKTALALAYCLRMRGMTSVLGITSREHSEFARATDLYHQVFTYDDVQSLPKDRTVAYIDFKCDGELRLAIDARLGTLLMYNLLAGPAVFQKKAAEGRFEKEQREVTFDAASWRQSRRAAAEVTKTGRDETLRYSYVSFVERMRQHIRLRTVSGPEAFVDMYTKLYSNESPPSEAYVCSLGAATGAGAQEGGADDVAVDEIWGALAAS